MCHPQSDDHTMHPSTSRLILDPASPTTNWDPSRPILSIPGPDGAHEYVTTLCEQSEMTSQLSKVETVSTSWIQAGFWVVRSKDWSNWRVPSDSSELGPDKASMRERIIWILSTETRARLENAIAPEKVIIRLQLERIREVLLTKSTQRIPQSASHDSDIQCSVVRHGAVRLCRLIWRMDSVAVRTCVG